MTVTINGVVVDAAGHGSPQSAAARELLRQRAVAAGIAAPDVSGNEADAAIEARHPGGSLFEEKRGVRWRSPLDEDDFVCDASCRELLVVELEGTEEAGREIAAVAIVSSRQDDAEKRRRVQ